MIQLIAHGLLYTLFIAGVSMAISLVLGTFLGICRYRAAQTPVGWLAWVYIECLRSIPLILFLVFVHYGVLPLLMERPNFLVSSLLAFSLFEAAYIAEIIRGGFRAIRPEERYAAKSLGLSSLQRLLHVYLPIVFQRSSPALVSQFISLMKDTSLASIVGVIELTRAGEILYEQTFQDFEILLFIASLYFCICYGLSLLSRRLESREHRECQAGQAFNQENVSSL